MEIEEADSVVAADNVVASRVVLASVAGQEYSRKDTVMASVARLDWNGERLLERAMTSFRLTLTNDLMPELMEELADILETEEDHHRVQQVVKRLFDRHAVKLFGVDAGSLIFILEHCSVDDASKTLNSRERQDELQQILLSLLPDWAAQLIKLRVTSYTLTSEDRAQNFGFKSFSSVSLVTGVHHRQRPSSPSRFRRRRWSSIASRTIDLSSIDFEESSRLKAYDAGEESRLKRFSRSYSVARPAEGLSASGGWRAAEEPKASTSYGFAAQAGGGS